MNPWRRFVRFNAVGALGVGVQLVVLWLLTDVAHLHYLWATLASVALAVAHNFVWHWRWTWWDRASSRSLVPAFVRFAGANGTLSLAANIGVMATLVSGAHVSAVMANTVAIGVCGLLNFWVGNEVVFRPSGFRASEHYASRWRASGDSPDNAQDCRTPADDRLERSPPPGSVRAARAGL